jgi:hypothetical protein
VRLPSIKTISQRFPYLHDEVKEIRNILERYAHHRPLCCLKKINTILECCGVEYIADRDDDYFNNYGVEYVNTGHSYAATFCYDRKNNRLFISTWGDIVERNPKRFRVITD